MTSAFLFARVLHVVFGVFWVGAMMFSAFYLFPSMREAGPEAAKVAAGLSKRRLVDVMPLAAVVTILSGFWLYWTVSAGFSPEYMGSRAGMAYGTGAVLALGALALGVAVVRTSMLRADALSRAAASSQDEEERGRALGEAQQLRGRAGKTGVLVAWLLILATLTMALGRYL